MQNLEVRTYVHKSKLTETQYKVREVLLTASKNLENSDLSLYPSIDIFPTNVEGNLALARVIIFHRIRNISYEICSQLLRSRPDFEIYKLDKCFKEIIRRNPNEPDAAEVVSDLLNSLGCREFMNATIHWL